MARKWNIGKFSSTDLSTDGVKYGENTTATKNTKEQEANNPSFFSKNSRLRKVTNRTISHYQP